MRGSGFAWAFAVVLASCTGTARPIGVTVSATKTALDLTEHEGVPTDVTFRDVTVRIDSLTTGGAHFDLDEELQDGEVFAIVGHPDGGNAMSIDVPAPAPLALIVTPTSLTRGDLAVTWTPSGFADAMDWTMGGECPLFSADGPIRDDTGTLTIPAEVLPNVTAPMGPCEVVLTVTRTRTVSPGGAAFVIIAQTRDANFTVTP
jgi:hypothetical protein